MAVTGDLSPAIVNLSGIRAGDKNEMIINITQAGTPYDLTGLTLEAQARLKNTDLGAPPIEAVLEVIDDPTQGHIYGRWPGADVRTALGDKATWKGVWDLQVQRDDDDPVTLMMGTFSAEQDVTR